MSESLQNTYNRFKVSQGVARAALAQPAGSPFRDETPGFAAKFDVAASTDPKDLQPAGSPFTDAVMPPPATTPGLALLPDTIDGRRQGAAAGKSFIDNDGSTWANDGDGGFNVQKPDGSALAPSSDYGDDLLADFHKQYPNGVHNADGSVNQPIGIDIASAAPIPIAPDPSAAPPVDPNANYGFTPAPAESPELTAAKAKAQESIAAFTPAPVEAPVVVNGFIADPADRAARGLPLLPADALAPTETPVEPTKPVNPITATGIDRLDLDPSVEGNGIGMVNPETGDPLISYEGVDSTRNVQALLPAGMAASDPTGAGQFKAIGGDGNMVLVSTQEEADRLNQNEYDVQAADKIAHQKFLASPEAAAMTQRQSLSTPYQAASIARSEAAGNGVRGDFNDATPDRAPGELSMSDAVALAGGNRSRARALVVQSRMDPMISDNLAANAGQDTRRGRQGYGGGNGGGEKSESTIKANVIAQRNGWIPADTPERAEAYIQLEKTNVATAQIEGFDAQIGELNNGYEALRGQARDAVASSFSGMEGDVASRVEESGMPVLQSLQDIVNTSKDADMVAAAKGYIQSIEQQTDATMLSDENQFGAQAAQYQKQIQAYNQYAEKVAMGAGISRTRGGQPTDALTSGTTTDDAAAHDAIAGLAGGAGATSSNGGGAADTTPDNSNALTPAPVDPDTSRAGRAVTATADALGDAVETTARTAAQMAETGMATTLAAANYIFGKGDISWEAAVAQAEVEAQSAAAALTSQYQQRGPVPVPYGR